MVKLFKQKVIAIIISLFLLLFLILPTLAQSGVPSADSDLIPMVGTTIALYQFPGLVTFAIAMEKTHSWTSPEADQLRQLLPIAQNTQCFAALQLLLAEGDTTGAIILGESARQGYLVGLQRR